jgi:hypothetical protein
MNRQRQDTPTELLDETLDRVTGGGQPPNPGYGLLTAQNQTLGSYNATHGYLTGSAHTPGQFSVGLGQQTK